MSELSTDELLKRIELVNAMDKLVKDKLYPSYNFPLEGNVKFNEYTAAKDEVLVDLVDACLKKLRS